MAGELVEHQALERATMRRVILRLVPFLMVCYFFALLDRVNVGFAALQMNKDLGLTPAMFGFAASLFFVSYFLVEVPSNLALQKVGARRWISRIMITWGMVTACMAFVVGPYSLYLMRFILGAAEAGFFPARSCISPTGFHRSTAQGSSPPLPYPFRWPRFSARPFRFRCWS